MVEFKQFSVKLILTHLNLSVILNREKTQEQINSQVLLELYLLLI